MSEPSDMFTCAACTFIQSSHATKCGMCETPNPLTLASMHPGATICPRCTFANTGNQVRACEMCGYDFDNEVAPKRFRVAEEEDNEEEEEEEDNDDDDEEEEEEAGNDYDYADFDALPMSQNSGAKRKPIEAVEASMNDDELRAYYQQYIGILKEERQQTEILSDQQLHETIAQLFRSLQYKHEQPEGQLVFKFCQICLDRSEPVITMKGCGHQVICLDDFHQYLSTRICDGDLLPWIPCPAKLCNVPCDAKNITDDGRLTHSELLSFIVKYMSKKLSRNENFISCVQCGQGGFLQFGSPKKEEVVCQVCNVKQTIEKGTDGDLDIAFKEMIQTGQLRECPTCRHLTLKEKGLCNVIECAKCGVWWNWQTREQEHNGRDLKQRARMNGSLWEPGELRYQQELERRNPAEFKALLERNGIQYDPNYVRGGWNDN